MSARFTALLRARMIPAMTPTTTMMMPIAKPALAPAEKCPAEPWAEVDVAVEDVDDDEGVLPYGQ
jgi:hypothetical protein